VSAEEITVHVIFAIGVIVALSHVLGMVARKVGQPAVVGHLLAGIALGPSLLGRLPGDLTSVLAPKEIQPYLTVVANVALVLFLFAVGYELDHRVLRGRSHAVPVVATATFGTTMLLGSGSVLVLGSWYSATGPVAVPGYVLVLFVAVAMSISAVPVLAGIVREHRLTKHVTGVVAMTSAGAVDGICWIVLAVVLLGADTQPTLPWLAVVTLLLLHVLVMVFVVRPALRWWFARSPGGHVRKAPVVIAVALGSACVTGALGLHVILGAFLAGMVLPLRDDGEPHPELLRPAHDAGSLLLPVFFVVSGLSVDIGGLHPSDIGLLVVVIVLAFLGRAATGTIAARATGLSWRDSSVIGVLLNTHGLTELIVLNLGLQAGIITDRLYTVFVLMALATTAATGPLLLLVKRRVASSGTACPQLWQEETRVS
jgi:K+:H+ antiporter